MGDFIVFLIFAALVYLLDKVDNKRKPVPKRQGKPKRQGGNRQQSVPPERTPQVQLPPPTPEPWPEQQRRTPDVLPQQPQVVWDIPAPIPPEEREVYREPGTVEQAAAEAVQEEMADEVRTAAYEAERAAEEEVIREQETVTYEEQAKLPGKVQAVPPLRLTPETALQAMALTAVLAPPVSRRPRLYRRRECM